MASFLKQNILFIAWAQALVATLISLYFSEVLAFPACNLCWYQRILMYPLVIIIPVGILKQDKLLPFYVLPLSILGMIIAFYQYLLQSGIIPQGLLPCGLGISCVNTPFNWFGFITIPLLSFAAFLIITFSFFIHSRTNQKS